MAGDFNHDGKMDLATPGAVLHGNGDGTFQTPKHVYSGNFPMALASGDLNRDGFSDLVICNNSLNISVLLGNARSVSQFERQVVGSQPKAVATGDFNSDGKLDVAVAASASNVVNILLGNGDGAFTPGANLTVPAPGAVLALDLNGDGKIDLAVSGDSGTWIFLGNGDGTFTQKAQYPSFYGDCTVTAFQYNGAPCFAAADFNGDGIPDLAGALWTVDSAFIMLGNGDGTFRPGTQTLRVSDTPQSIATGDFNKDGKIDVVISGLFGSVFVFPGNGDGTFNAPVLLSSGTGSAGLAVGDVNGDGNLDIVLAAGQAGGSGSFLGVYVFTPATAISPSIRPWRCWPTRGRIASYWVTSTPTDSWKSLLLMRSRTSHRAAESGQHDVRPWKAPRCRGVAGGHRGRRLQQ